MRRLSSGLLIPLFADPGFFLFSWDLHHLDTFGYNGRLDASRIMVPPAGIRGNTIIFEREHPRKSLQHEFPAALLAVWFFSHLRFHVRRLNHFYIPPRTAVLSCKSGFPWASHLPIRIFTPLTAYMPKVQAMQWGSRLLWKTLAAGTLTFS